MTPLPVISNVYRCAVDWSTATGLTATNVFHVQSSSEDESGIASAINDAGDLSMLNQVYAAANMVSLSITQLDGTSGTQVFEAPLWGSGSGSGDAIPQACVLVSLKTALRGAANRGRIYLPFVAEGEQSSGVLASGNLSTAQSAWEDFVNAMATSSTPLVIASYVHAAAHLVTNVRLGTIIATQRRRVDRLR